MTPQRGQRSRGTCTSFSTIEAMMSTSYGVRFLSSAYSRSTRSTALERLELLPHEGAEVVSSVNS